MGNGQDRTAVLAEIRLVQAPAPPFRNLVHGNDKGAALARSLAVMDRTAVIRRGHGSGVAHHLEAFQGQGSGKRMGLSVPVLPLADRDVRDQFYFALLRAQMRHQRAGEHDEESQVEGEGPALFRNAPLQQEHHSAHGRHRPEGDEPPAVIECGQRRLGSPEFFKNRGSHHREDDRCHGTYRYVLEECFH